MSYMQFASTGPLWLATPCVPAFWTSNHYVASWTPECATLRERDLLLTHCNSYAIHAQDL